MSKLKNPMSPGEVLVELYLKPMNKNMTEFSQILDIHRTTISRIIKGTTRISPRTALKLATVFNTTPNYWMNLQTNYDLFIEKQKGDIINKPFKIRISPRTALKLAKEFNTAPNYWMNLQADHDIYKERPKVDLSKLKPLEIVQ